MRKLRKIVIRTMGPVRRLLDDARAQAMTEAAIAMPVVVLFLLAAHEFMWFNHNHHRQIWSTRHLVWEVALATNHPDHTDGVSGDSLQGGTGEISVATRNTKYNTVKNQVYDLFFKGKPGHKQSYHAYYTQYNGSDSSTGMDGGYGYAKSFPFSDLGSTSSGENPLSLVGDAFAFLFAGTTFEFPVVGSIQLGPDLPIRGVYETGYIVGWEPAFFRLLLPGSGRGSSSRSFLASAGTEAQWDDISVDWGGANLIWLGWTKNPGGTSTWYGRLAIITHDWRAVDNEDLWAHTKGFTLPGAFQSGAMQSKFSITEALGTVMGDVLPFNCYVYPDLVGQPSETEKMRDTQK